MNKQQRKQQHIEELRKLGFIGQFFQLKKLESWGNTLSLNYSNGDLTTEQFQDDVKIIERKLAKLFRDNKLPKGVFVNTDPRGAALKLDSEYNPYNQETYSYVISQRDWGGNGILVPEEF